MKFRIRNMTKVRIICVLCLVNLIFAGCSTDSMDGGAESYSNAISFGGQTGAVTRADIRGSDAATLLNGNFVVCGVKGSDVFNSPEENIEVFDHYSVNYIQNTSGSSITNSSDWEYVGQPLSTNPIPNVAAAQIVKYWDPLYSQYAFLAFSRGNNADVTFSKADMSNIGRNIGDSGATPVYTIEGPASEIQKTYISDLVMVESPDFGKPVVLKFRRFAAKVRFAMYETIPGYSVKDVMFYTSDDAAEPESTPCLYTTGNDRLASGNGTVNVYMPNDTTTLLNFTPSSASSSSVQDFAGLTYYSAQYDEASGTVYVGRTSHSASYAGINDSVHGNAYVEVLPLSKPMPLTLRVKYTLVSTDGRGEEIEVGPITAHVPGEFAEWRPNYAYTYLFKITDEGSGLYPIILDAVEINDGVSETEYQCE